MDNRQKLTDRVIELAAGDHGAEQVVELLIGDLADSVTQEQVEDLLKATRFTFQELDEETQKDILENSDMTEDEAEQLEYDKGGNLI